MLSFLQGFKFYVNIVFTFWANSVVSHIKLRLVVANLLDQCILVNNTPKVNMDNKQTPLEKHDSLANKLNINNLIIKREDLNPSGSHKDRGVWVMMEEYKKTGVSDFVISSSGNSAISSAYYVSRFGDDNINKLHIFISPRMPEDKKLRLDECVRNNKKIEIHVSERAKSDAFLFAKNNKYKLLRASTDDSALIGYRGLAIELYDQLYSLLDYGNERGEAEGGFANPDTRNWDIFVPTSSGTTLLGMHEGFELRKSTIQTNMEIAPGLHAVQTSKCHTIVKKLGKDTAGSEVSLATAIVDTIGHRKERVVEAIKNSGGDGWVVNDKDLKNARDLLESNTDIKNASWDSLLSLAGLVKALENRTSDINNAILLFTGK